MPSMRVSQREVVERLKNEELFILSTGNLRSGRAFDDKGWTYFVTSYFTDIARIRVEQLRGEDGELLRNEDGSIKEQVTTWINDQYYSRTTSRHVGYVRRAWNIPKKK